MSQAIAVTGAQKYLKPIKNDIKTSDPLPYIAFAFKMADNWGSMSEQIKGLQETNPVLAVDGKYRKLDPLRFFFVEAERIYVERDQGRDAKRATTKECDFADPRKEEVHAVVLALTPDGLVPATLTFKKGACKGAKTVCEESNIVNDPDRIGDWIARSPDHKAAAAIPYPLGRFVATVKSGMKPPKGGGKPYLITQATTAPTTASEAALLAKFFTDEASVARLNAVCAFNQNRLSELKKLEGK